MLRWKLDLTQDSARPIHLRGLTLHSRKMSNNAGTAIHIMLFLIFEKKKQEGLIKEAICCPKLAGPTYNDLRLSPSNTSKQCEQVVNWSDYILRFTERPEAKCVVPFGERPRSVKSTQGGLSLKREFKWSNMTSTEPIDLMVPVCSGKCFPFPLVGLE